MGATSVVLAMTLFAGSAAPGFPPGNFTFMDGFDRALRRLFPLCHNDSAVVAAPATIGAVAGGTAGLAVGVVAVVPVGALEWAAHSVAGGGGSEMPAATVAFVGPPILGAVAGHYALGGPVYVTKLVVWDGPVTLVTKGPGAVWRGVREAPPLKAVGNAVRKAPEAVRRWWGWYGP